MPWTTDSIEKIAKEKASTFLHLSKSVRPSVVCVLRVGNGRDAKIFVGESSAEDRQMHATVNLFYGQIPNVYRSLNHGGCAEADALSKALNRGINPTALRGAECQAVITQHTRLVPPCQSCTQVLRRLNIRYTGDVNFSAVLTAINAIGARGQ